MLRFLIGDDHALLRQGLTWVLTKEFEGADVQEVGTGQEVIDLVRSQTWDALILDINFPDKNGLEVLKETKILRPKLPVLILSFYSEKQYALRSLKSGAAGYLTKDSELKELVTTVRKILQGGKYVSPSVAENLESSSSSEQSPQSRSGSHGSSVEAQDGGTLGATRQGRSPAPHVLTQVSMGSVRANPLNVVWQGQVMSKWGIFGT